LVIALAEANAFQDPERPAPRNLGCPDPENPHDGSQARLRHREIHWDASDESVVVEEGSLYPALYRMERRGWLEAEWGESELGRRAKLYRLTPDGRAQLKAETAAWRQFATGVSKILLAQST